MATVEAATITPVSFPLAGSSTGKREIAMRTSYRRQGYSQG
jgi:hypothetical protein